MPLRVIQWATGTVGIHAVPAIVAHPDLELAGVAPGLAVGVHPEARQLELGVGDDGGHGVDADGAGRPLDHTDGRWRCHGCGT